MHLFQDVYVYLVIYISVSINVYVYLHTICILNGYCMYQYIDHIRLVYIDPGGSLWLRMLKDLKKRHL